MSWSGDGCYQRWGRSDGLEREIAAALELIEEMRPVWAVDRPAPFADNKLARIWGRLERRGYAEAFKFGFANKEQLLQWFTVEELEVFEMAGIHLYEVEAATVLRGEHQAIFRNPQKYERIPLEALLE
jgi:hypothetical protein